MTVDKTINNAYIWHSPATDVTGKKLAEALRTKHGGIKPATKDVSLIIGWGAKTSAAVLLGNTPVLNHPDAIRKNRNKLAALETMQKAKVSVAAFIPASEQGTLGQKKCPVSLPCIARTKYHQGGKGLWECPTMTHVAAALQAGAQYLQNLIEIRDEYRLHVFGNEVIYGAKKVKRTEAETAEAYIRQEMEKHRAKAAKVGRAFDESAIRPVLEDQAKVFAQHGPSMSIRSNRVGWKFARVKSVPKELETEAAKALKALGLDFGAVDCCIDATGKAYIIEVNSGPGLEESTFDAWVAAFKTKIAEILTPKRAATASAASRIPESRSSAAASGTRGAGDGIGKGNKAGLKNRIDLMQEMVDKADDGDAATLNRIFSKMFE